MTPEFLLEEMADGAFRERPFPRPLPPGAFSSRWSTPTVPCFGVACSATLQSKATEQQTPDTAAKTASVSPWAAHLAPLGWACWDPGRLGEGASCQR